MTKAVSTKASKAKKTSGELNPTGGFRLFCQENRDEGDVLIHKFSFSSLHIIILLSS